MKERQLLEEDFLKLGIGEKGQQVIEDVLDLESYRFEKVETVRCLNCLEEILNKAVKDPDYKDDYEKVSRWLLPEQISLSKFSKNSKLIFLETKVDGRWNFGVRRFF